MTTTQSAATSVLTYNVSHAPQLLASDEPMLLHFPGLLRSHYCDAVAQRLRTLSLTPYEATTGSDEFAPIPKLGPALFEFHDEMSADAVKGLDAYLDQARHDSDLIRGLFAKSTLCDPLDVLHSVASDLLGGELRVAEEGERECFSGVVRDINGGALPHYDDASVDTPHLTVGQTDRQLSIVFYLTDFSGGALTSYDKKPTAHDNAANQLGYGYTREAVQGACFRGVVPAKGSVVIFNPRYIHSVAPILTEQRRLTFSAFIGRMHLGELISWS